VMEVEMHDGSMVVLKKLERDYDPTNKWNALQILDDAQQNNWLITGLIYVEEDEPALYELYNLPESPLNRLIEKDLRPKPDTLEKINKSMA
jgi:2-oxoglutarate ferredoxin oxidoreductase subunit beta